MINTKSRIGFIGGGNMAEAIINGITSHGMKDITVSEPAEERREYLGRNFGVNAIESNRELASSCNIIILAVKPQNIDTVVNEICEAITEKKTVVSIAAGITLQYLTSKLKTKKLVRVMPNTPALVQEGMTVMAMCECFTDRDITIVREIFMSVGKVIVLPEKFMNAVTALSGSGPAFIAFFVEAMAEGGIRMGLKNDDALTLAVQTMIGTSKLLGAGMSPSKVREMVTSPGGTTAAGLKAFDEKGFKDTVITAVAAAKNRAEELGRTG
jgi:pyrroline-5-carboxylate reductase